MSPCDAQQLMPRYKDLEHCFPLLCAAIPETMRSIHQQTAQVLQAAILVGGALCTPYMPRVRAC
jgi:hypothetical protein